MPTYVSVSISSHPLRREETGVVFEVTTDDGMRFGELVVSKGGVRWRARNERDHHFLSWSRLDEVMSQAPKR
jgi:hypothetical protein